ncbi:hypothetical protein D3C87_1571430 [compost metagenome]
MDKWRNVNLLAGDRKAFAEHIQQRMFGRNKAWGVATFTVLLIKVGEGIFARLIHHQNRKVEFRAQVPLIKRSSFGDKIDNNLLHASHIAMRIQPAFLIFARPQHHVLITGSIDIVPHLTGGEVFIAHKMALITMGNFMQASPVIVFRG